MCAMSMNSWHEAFAGFRRTLRAAGRSEQTIYLRGRHLETLRRAVVPLGPFEVEETHLEQWLSNPRWSIETRRSHRSSVRVFYAWAHRRGLVESDPTLNLPAIRPALPRPRPAPDHALLAALRSSDPRVRLAVRLGAEAGLRRGEIVKVHARDVMEDLTGHSLIVHGKGGRLRVVPLNDSLARKLRRAVAHGGFAFPGDDNGHLSPGWLGKLVSRALPEGVTPHALRHRFATRAYGASRDVFAVQELLGHASPETTRRYVQVNAERLRGVVEQVAA